MGRQCMVAPRAMACLCRLARSLPAVHVRGGDLVNPCCGRCGGRQDGGRELTGLGAGGEAGAGEGSGGAGRGRGGGRCRRRCGTPLCSGGSRFVVRCRRAGQGRGWWAAVAGGRRGDPRLSAAGPRRTELPVVVPGEGRGEVQAGAPRAAGGGRPAGDRDRQRTHPARHLLPRGAGRGIRGHRRPRLH